MLLSAAVVGVIERRWSQAAAWSAVAALLSACGLMHSYQWTFGDTALRLAPAWPFVIGYTGMSLLFVTARWTTEEIDGLRALNEMTVKERERFHAANVPV